MISRRRILLSATTAADVAVNVAQDCKVFSSGFESPFSAANAVDGNTDTRWSSDFVDGCWLSLDLGKTYSKIVKFEIDWEIASAEEYQIEVSADGATWTEVVHRSNQSIGAHEVTIDNVSDVTARYVRFTCVKRKTQYGCSLYEFRVFATDDGVVSPARYEYILSVMPTELKDALVAWYDPQLQELTNDDLIDEYPIFVGGLQDLSGNGYDATIYNADGEAGGYVDDDGYLQLDGADDFIKMYLSYEGGWSLMTDVAYAQQSSLKFALASHEIVDGTAKYFYRVASNKAAQDGVIYIDYDSANAYSDIAIASHEGWEGDSACIGKLRSTTASYFTPMTLRHYVHFNRALTDSERTWVKTNMFDY